MSRRRPPRFRRSPHLVGYWRAGRFVVHNYATGSVAALPPGTTMLLDFFDDWRTIDELMEHASTGRGEARRLLAALTDATLLQSSQRRPSRRESALQEWSSWNPAAGFFHMATRDVRFLDPIAGERELRRKARTSAMPAVVKRYPRAQRTALPRVKPHGELVETLLARRTWRQFSRRPLPLPLLSELLGLTGGIQQWAEVWGGELALKTSPSGGARHPIEIYVLARRVATLRPGLYHYAPDRHQLELVRAEPRPVRVERYLPRQFWYEGAAALVFFSAVFARVMWKYTYARSYRAVLIEAGHQCQTFCLAATRLGLAPFCSMALADSRIESDLGLDGVSEAVLYAAGVGLRPKGRAPAARPTGFAPLRVRPNRRVMEPLHADPTRGDRL